MHYWAGWCGSSKWFPALPIPKLRDPFSGGLGANFQKSTWNFLSPVLSWNFHLEGGGWLVTANFQKSTWNFLSPVLSWNFHLEGGGWLVTANFQKSTWNFLSPVLSWNFHLEGSGMVGDGQFSKVNLKFSKSSPELKFPFPGFWEGVEVGDNQLLCWLEITPALSRPGHQYVVPAH